MGVPGLAPEISFSVSRIHVGPTGAPYSNAYMISYYEHAASSNSIIGYVADLYLLLCGSKKRCSNVRCDLDGLPSV